jgi:Ca-activated chloride channel family protein
MVFAGATSPLRPSLWVVVTVIANLGISLAPAQDQINEVHILPRAEMSAPEAPANLLSSSLDTHTEPLRKQVDLVLVPVTITDPRDRIVTGLESGNFQLYEGKQRQEIRHFSTEDAPLSLGILLDVSSSMKNKIERAREAVREFLRAANQQDEFFMITFSDRPQLLRDFADAGGDAPLQGLLAAPKGRTALLDAIYLGLAKMRQAKYQRRALLVISDGGDNHSRYTEREIRSLAKEADVAIYAIGIFDRFFPTQEELLGPFLLNDLSEISGGRSYTVDNPNDLPAIAERVGMALRNQYVLAYRPEKSKHDGKWHAIRVRLRLPKGLPPLHVFAKTGYYAASR